MSKIETPKEIDVMTYFLTYPSTQQYYISHLDTTVRVGNVIELRYIGKETYKNFEIKQIHQCGGCRNLDELIQEEYLSFCPKVFLVGTITSGRWKNQENCLFCLTSVLSRIIFLDCRGTVNRVMEV